MRKRQEDARERKAQEEDRKLVSTPADPSFCHSVGAFRFNAERCPYAPRAL
jgi:hypothetical protein